MDPRSGGREGRAEIEEFENHETRRIPEEFRWEKRRVLRYLEIRNAKILTRRKGTKERHFDL